MSLVTSRTEDYSVIGATSDWSCFPEYIDINIPSPLMNQIEEPYMDLFNSPPRKEVPLGSDHQVEVPLWDPNTIYFCDDFREERLTGTCIIAMPNLNNSTMEGVGVGRGRTDCCCLDMGSMRCVQQHVNEAREKLQETIGYENFLDLGFCNMGHEVAYQWTPHEEEVFHDIVYSNPESHGRKFWKHLNFAFPTRTKNELVSYYFNVFMLRRRAVQNRSYLLEIDSDDDEELRGVHGGSHQERFYSSDQETDIEDHQGHKGQFYLVEGEEEESTVYSFGDQDLDTSWVDSFWSEPQNSSEGHEVSNIKDDVSDGQVEKLDVVEMKSLRR
ncbi:AT-rich interactive domain-containing protein 2 isoform X2 [Salvia hispanica]|nr:AT-rich interactive domain-containing protein 2 isoform X2 [Salvia hispanica]